MIHASGDPCIGGFVASMLQVSSDAQILRCANASMPASETEANLRLNRSRRLEPVRHAGARAAGLEACVDQRAGGEVEREIPLRDRIVRIVQTDRRVPA